MSDAKYFHTTKRGEIHELKEELHQLDKTKKKEAVKKVVFLSILPVIASFLLNRAFCDFSWMYAIEKGLTKSSIFKAEKECYEARTDLNRQIVWMRSCF